MIIRVSCGDCVHINDCTDVFLTDIVCPRFENRHMQDTCISCIHYTPSVLHKGCGKCMNAAVPHMQVLSSDTCPEYQKEGEYE